MIKYFYQLSTLDNIRNILLEEIETRNDWFESNGFQILSLTMAPFRDSKLNNLIKEFQGTPLIFKLDPLTWYNWHVDETRVCAVNMLLTGDDSHCFYSNDVSTDVVHLTELNYQEDRYYLLNTKAKHAVLNLHNTRYMLSIGFRYPASYELILKFCKENDL